jgi:hypothetical protein
VRARESISIAPMAAVVMEGTKRISVREKKGNEKREKGRD